MQKSGMPENGGKRKGQGTEPSPKRPASLLPHDDTAVKPQPKDQSQEKPARMDVAAARPKKPKEQFDPLIKCTVGNPPQASRLMNRYMDGGPCKELVSILNDNGFDDIKRVLEFEGIRLANGWTSTLNAQPFKIFPVHLVLRNEELNDPDCGYVVRKIVERIRISTDFDEDEVNKLLSQQIEYTLDQTRHSYTTMYLAVKFQRESAVKTLCELEYPSLGGTGAYERAKMFPELLLAISASSDPTGFKIMKHLFQSNVYTEEEKMTGLLAFIGRTHQKKVISVGHALGLITMVVNTGNPFGDVGIRNLMLNMGKDQDSAKLLVEGAQEAAEKIMGVSKDTIPYGILTIIGALCIRDYEGTHSKNLLRSMKQVGMTKVPGLDTLMGYLLLKAALGNGNKVWFDYLMSKYKDELRGRADNEDIKELKDVFAGNESKGYLLEGTEYGELFPETPTPDPSLRAKRVRDREKTREEAIKRQTEEEARKEAEKEVAKKMARLKREEEKIIKKQRELEEELKKLKGAM